MRKGNRKLKKATNRSELNGKYGIYILLFRAVLMVAVIMAILMGVLAVIMTAIDVPLSAIDAGGLITIITSITTASCWIGSIYRKNGFLLGVTLGLIVYILMFAISMFYLPETGILAVTKLVICICSGAFGGIYGVNMRKSSKLQK